VKHRPKTCNIHPLDYRPGPDVRKRHYKYRHQPRISKYPPQVASASLDLADWVPFEGSPVEQKTASDCRYSPPVGLGLYQVNLPVSHPDDQVVNIAVFEPDVMGDDEPISWQTVQFIPDYLLSLLPP